MGMLLRAAVVAMAVATIFELAMGVNYDVGQPGGGWDLTTNYAKWVSGKKFQTDDTITFTYASNHDVVEVNGAAYAACDASSPISKDATGRTVVKLTAVGKRYFICSIPGHCGQGMKVEIDVVASSLPAPSGPPASPAPGSAPAAPSPGSSASSPPSPSGAADGGLGMRTKLALGFAVAMMLVLGL